MLLVSLDEGGFFENGRYGMPNACMVIGGAIYRCNPGQESAQAERILRYTRSICDANRCPFPDSLHPKRNTHDEIVNGRELDLVKPALRKTIGDFLHGTGAWKNDPPKGTYSVYAMLGDPVGMSRLWQGAQSNLLNDNYASNRYEHMAYRVVKNLLFRDPRLAGENDVKLHLATRKYDTKNWPDAISQARTIGATEAGRLHVATSPESFRSMLKGCLNQLGIRYSSFIKDM